MCSPAEIEVAAEPIAGRAPRRTAARSMILVVFIGHLVALRDAIRVRVVPGVGTATALGEGIRARTMPDRFPRGISGEDRGRGRGCARWGTTVRDQKSPANCRAL